MDVDLNRSGQLETPRGPDDIQNEDDKIHQGEQVSDLLIINEFFLSTFFFSSKKMTLLFWTQTQSTLSLIFTFLLLKARNCVLH